MSVILKKIGEALYGSRWQTDLSGALDISDRHMRRLVSGEAEIPDGMWEDLRALCEAREKELGKLIAAIPKRR